MSAERKRLGQHEPFSIQTGPNEVDVMQAGLTTSMLHLYRSSEKTALIGTSIAGKWAEVGAEWGRLFLPSIYRELHSAALAPWRESGAVADIFLEKREIGITPKVEVASHGFAKLYRYESPDEYDPSVPDELLNKRSETPVMLVFARMNRPDIMDLAKNKSFVEHMTRQGYPIYLMDWGRFEKGMPGWQEHRNIDFAHDVLGTLPYMVGEMKRDSGAKSFDLLGWCQGAVMTSMYAAVQPEVQPEAGLERLVCLTPPFDFSGDDGAITKMANENYRKLQAMVLANGGVMPGAAIDLGVKLRNPQAYLFGPYDAAHKVVKAGDDRGRESMVLMQTWLQDLTDLPGAWYLQFINELYMNNNLVRGNIILTDPKTGSEHKVNLKNVKTPTLVIGAAKDDIAPHGQWENSGDLFGGPIEVYKIEDAGHISLMTGGKYAKKTWGLIGGFLDRNEDHAPSKGTIYKKQAA